MKSFLNGKIGRITGKTVLIAGLVVAIGAVAFFLMPSKSTTFGKKEFQKGVGYVTWSKNGYLSVSSDASLEKVQGLGSNWTSILVTWYQTNPGSFDIHMTEKTPSDEAVMQAIRKAKGLGMKVMLKLHLDLIDKSDGSWRGEISCFDESSWDNWFKEYNDYMNYYIRIANQEDVEMICIGTELSACATVKGYRWSEMIKKMRNKYKGQLTYAAHWDRYQDIRFWNDLDYVGINAYFPLTEKMDPTYDELIEGWKKWVPEMEAFQKKVNMPIIFPEIGCSSADGAAIRPWEHVPRSEVNMGMQERYYQALLNIFWQKDWFYGVYWWYWGTNVNMGGKYNRGFTPQNKPAEQVIRKWYAKRVNK